MTDPAKVQADFDRIALLPADPGACDHNAWYHRQLLRHVPAGCDAALDVGCGTGAFARELARRCKHVVALDLSPNMIRAARAGSADFGNIDYQEGDVLRLDLGESRFDCVVSIATLHHLPMDEILPRLARALCPDGVVLVLDLRASRGPGDRSLDVVAAAVSVAARFLRTGRLRPPEDVRHAWREHGAGDVYPTMREVRAMCRRHLPGAAVRRHLMWRYSIVWRKGSGS